MNSNEENYHTSISTSYPDLKIEDLEESTFSKLPLNSDKLSISFEYKNDAQYQEGMKKIYKLIEFLKKSRKKIDLHLFTEQILMKDAVQLNEQCDKNFNIFLNHSDEALYSIPSIVKRQEKAKIFIDKINNASPKLTPLEAYALIYTFVANNVYKESTTNLLNSRELYSVLAGDEIVCVGYANLLSFLCSNINDKNLRCAINGLVVKNHGGHANNIIRIKDDEYGVNGCYIADACWDSINHKGDYPTFCFSLVSLEQYEKLSCESILFTDLNCVEKLNDIIENLELSEPILPYHVFEQKVIDEIKSTTEYINNKKILSLSRPALEEGAISYLALLKTQKDYSDIAKARYKLEIQKQTKNRENLIDALKKAPEIKTDVLTKALNNALQKIGKSKEDSLDYASFIWATTKYNIESRNNHKNIKLKIN